MSLDYAQIGESSISLNKAISVPYLEVTVLLINNRQVELEQVPSCKEGRQNGASDELDVWRLWVISGLFAQV